MTHAPSSPSPAPSASSAQDGLPAPRKYWALLAAMLAIAITVLETTITNIALPAIAADLGITPAQAVWVVNTYQLAIVATLLPFASMGEIYGYRRVFLWGLAVFTASAAGCALSRSFEPLIGFRVLQGLGAAACMSVTPALLRYIYSQQQFGRAIGFNALIVALASALGPMLGSLILSVAPWPWLFAISLPLGAFVLWIGRDALPATERAQRPFDWISATLSALFFGLLIVGIDRLLNDIRTALMLIAFAAVAACALIWRELPRAAPLLPLDLMRIRPFAYSVGASICAFSAQSMAFIALPFYFQHAMERSQLETGLLMIPWPIGVAITAPLAGRLSESVSPSLLCTIGTSMVGVGLAVIVALPASASNSLLMGCMACCGIGFGLFQTPNNRVMLTSAPRHRSGGAGGMQATARQFGMAWGAALVGLAFTAVPRFGPAAALLLGVAFNGAAAIVSAARRSNTLPNMAPPTR